MKEATDHERIHQAITQWYYSLYPRRGVLLFLVSVANTTLPRGIYQDMAVRKRIESIPKDN